MKCSVSIVTFQQAGFIRQAVESALDQKTSFPIEVIVGDDASTDGTREILQEVQRAEPSRLRLLLAERNYGDNGLSNVMATIDAARGQYIAFLDGDDYWTTAHKLQRQVDFMDAHPDCNVSAHRVEHISSEGVQGLSVRPGRGDRLWTYDSLLAANFTPKSATMIRRSALANLPDWYRTAKVSSAAWLFNLLVANGGKIGFIDEVMAAHRLHENSLTVNYGVKRMLTDKLVVFELLRPLVPGQTRALHLAERKVCWKLMVARHSPRSFSALKRIYNTITRRP